MSEARNSASRIVLGMGMSVRTGLEVTGMTGQRAACPWTNTVVLVLWFSLADQQLQHPVHTLRLPALVLLASDTILLKMQISNETYLFDLKM